MKYQLSMLALLATICTSASAAECQTTVEANDAMQFSVKSMEVPKSCKKFDVTLKHTGKMPKNMMGHNFVVSLEADKAGISTDGMTAGAAANYIKPNDKRVIAATKVIGGGESTTVSIPVGNLAAGSDYVFFCSFPGHAAVMKGSLKVGS